MIQKSCQKHEEEQEREGKKMKKVYWSLDSKAVQFLTSALQFAPQQNTWQESFVKHRATSKQKRNQN
jgi:N-acetylneuraminic acid mutarotase